ncbi:putative bifunctional diguanylate cyclase/phosphodiesterase [Sphingomonas sp. IC4-52]|uniref:putative bifunctional diguanylate cyclase/phosphodiesterase n=1 Tax=Sphingomonas sp. IC4-52 TaxID=2887202 RepID=UPI001D121764|nr:EAL domain-containing protein [Sphingomonas sp. IC4-52]MCC2981061.1 EAL domain-containing protein [Sphingomonas sp. IC4-52]
MFFRPFKQVAQSSDVLLREQFARLRTQIPLMYALMVIDSAFLGLATYGEVPITYSLGMPAMLLLGVMARAGLWMFRNFKAPTAAQIRRYLVGTIIASALLSIAFGLWGFMLLGAATPARGPAIALFVFVGSISCCYCLQALPVAGLSVLVFGAMPITLRLLASGDWYLAGVALTFLMVSFVVVRAMAGSHKAFTAALEARSEMADLVAALRDSEERYRLASQASSDVIWDVPLQGDQIGWSSAVGTTLGYPEALAGTTRQWWIDRIHPEDRHRIGVDAAALKDPQFTNWTQEFRVLAGSGDYLTMRSRGFVVRDQDGRATRLVGSLQDVTAQRRYESELRFAAHYDPLTQLPNRLLFAERLDAALANARQGDGRVGLIVFDVDRFKTINDSLGHDAGDALLCEVAARLQRIAPPGATAARLAGDEFAIIIPGLDHSGIGTTQIAALLAEISSPMTFAGRHIDVSLSAGFAAAFRDGNTADEIHKSADLALYAAKRDCRGGLREFNRGLRDAAEREKHMLADARAGLQADWIVPFYQPKICLKTGDVLGFEALLRWHHPQQGLRSPASISAAFEDPTTSVQITDRMLERTISDMARWADQGVQFGRIAINGSPEDFRRGNFAERILERLERAKLPPSMLELEVTETVFLGQLAENVSVALKTLSEAGIQIALDDFGTGYASLTHLKQFPVDALKIDRSFVSRLTMVDCEDSAIVGAVIELARSLKITTVAEGVETSTQAAHLIVKGCDIGQGYLFSRPMAAEQVGHFTASWDSQSVPQLCGSADWAAAARQSYRERFR